MYEQGIFAPVVRVVRSVMGVKAFNKLRGKGIQLHSQVITEFCKTIGAPPKVWRYVFDSLSTHTYTHTYTYTCTRYPCNTLSTMTSMRKRGKRRKRGNVSDVY